MPGAGPPALPAGQPGPPAAGAIHLDRWLPLVHASFVPTLVHPGECAHLSAVAPYLPGDALTAFEVRLGATATATADVAIRLTDPAQCRRLAPLLSPPSASRFLQRSAATGRFPPGVASLWLELDLGRWPRAQRMGDLPFPALLIAELEETPDVGGLLDGVLPALCDPPPTLHQRERIERCCRLLPPSARLLYLFNLEARGNRAVRLEIAGPDLPDLLSYLEDLAPSAVASPLTAAAPLLRDADRFHLSFDITSEILPRLGLEASFVRLPHREPGWGRLFDRLVAAGLCSEEKRRAVFTWPGQDTFWSAPSLWPAESVGVRGAFARCLSHAKLVTEPGREPEAKAYLVCQYLRRPPPPGDGGRSSHRGRPSATRLPTAP